MATRRRNLLEVRRPTPLEVIARPTDTYVRPDIPPPLSVTQNTWKEAGDAFAQAVPGVAKGIQAYQENEALKKEGLQRGAGGRLQDTPEMRQAQAALLRMDGPTLSQFGKIDTADQVKALREAGVENPEAIIENLRFQRMAGSMAARQLGYTDGLYERFDEITNPLSGEDLEAVLAEYRQQFFKDSGFADSKMTLEYELGLTAEFADMEEGFRREVSRKRSERYMQEKADLNAQTMTSAMERLAMSDDPAAQVQAQAEIVELAGAGGRQVAQLLHESVMNVALDVAADGDLDQAVRVYNDLLSQELIPQYEKPGDTTPKGFQALGDSAPVRSQKYQDMSTLRAAARQAKEKKVDKDMQARGAGSRALMGLLKEAELPSSQQLRKRALMEAPDQNPFFQAAFEEAQKVDPELNSDEFYQSYWLAQGVDLAMRFTDPDSEIDQDLKRELMIAVANQEITRDELIDKLRANSMDPEFSFRMLQQMDDENNPQARSAKTVVSENINAEFSPKWTEFLTSQGGRDLAYEIADKRLLWNDSMKELNDEQRREYVKNTIRPELEELRKKYEPALLTSSPIAAWPGERDKLRQQLLERVTQSIEAVKGEGLSLTLSEEAELESRIVDWVDTTLDRDGRRTFDTVFQNVMSTKDAKAADPQIRAQLMQSALSPRVLQRLSKPMLSWIEKEIAPYISARQQTTTETNAPALGPQIDAFPVNGNTAFSGYYDSLKQAVAETDPQYDPKPPRNSQAIVEALGFAEQWGSDKWSLNAASDFKSRQATLGAFFRTPNAQIPPGPTRTRPALQQEYVGSLMLSGISVAELESGKTRHGVRFEDIGLSPLKALSNFPVLVGDELVEAGNQESQFRRILERLGITDKKAIDEMLARQDRIDKMRFAMFRQELDITDDRKVWKRLYDHLKVLRK